MALQKVINRFQTHNRTRIARLIELAPKKSQTFFQLLPLLFQSNNETLPGFIVDAPHGIMNYEPSKQALDSAKILNRDFSYHHQALHHYPILGLYLINNSGSLNYPAQAEFDLLLIYSSKTLEQEIDFLKHKLDKVVIWADSFEIKIKYQLLNEATLTQSQSPLTGDELDKFYCNGLVLAGSLPIWWCISPDETNYQHAVKEAQQDSSIQHFSFLDFGPLSTRSAETIFNDGYKYNITAMEKGLSGFLDLLYQQTIIEHFPNSSWIAEAFKKEVYNKQTDTFLCDNNILKLNYLSSLLPQNLLTLARQSLYLLCNEKLSLTVKQPAYPWRRESLSTLSNSWLWSNYIFTSLDHRYKSKFSDRLKEFNISKLLNNQFSTLLAEFSQKNQLNTEQKTKEIKAKFHDLFNSSPDVITTLPTSLLPQEAEDYLFIERKTTQDGWNIYESEKGPDNPAKPLNNHHSLLHAVSWAISNKIADASTRIRITDATNAVSPATALALTTFLFKSKLVDNLATESNKPEQISQLLLFANIEHTPEEAFKRQDLKLSIKQQDPFNYSFHRRNIIPALECLILTSHGQSYYFDFQENDLAVAEILTLFLRWKPSASIANNISCLCPTPSLGPRISHRLTTVCKHVLEHYCRNPNSGNYILEIADRLLRIQWHEQGTDYSQANKKQNIDSFLGESRPTFSATRVDSEFDNEGFYDLLLSHQGQEKSTLFLYLHKQVTTTYFLDEVGSIYKMPFSNFHENTIVRHFNDFLEKSLRKENINAFHFFSLQNNYSSWSATEIPVIEETPQGNYFPVRVALKSSLPDSKCIIRCGTKVFTGLLNNSQLFAEVRKLVIQLRNNHSDYPLYISEISFSEPQNNSRNYILKKQQIEYLLNKD